MFGESLPPMQYNCGNCASVVRVYSCNTGWYKAYTLQLWIRSWNLLTVKRTYYPDHQLHTRKCLPCADQGSVICTIRLLFIKMPHDNLSLRKITISRDQEAHSVTWERARVIAMRPYPLASQQYPKWYRASRTWALLTSLSMTHQRRPVENLTPLLQNDSNR